MIGVIILGLIVYYFFSKAKSDAGRKMDFIKGFMDRFNSADQNTKIIYLVMIGGVLYNILSFIFSCLESLQ